MFNDENSKTTAYLLISLMCFVGILVPIPLAPVTFFVSAGLLIMSKQEYDRVSLEGHPDGLRIKLGITMAACLGNILGTIMMFLLVVIAFYIVLSNPFPDIQTDSSTVRNQINIENFNQTNNYHLPK